MKLNDDRAKENMVNRLKRIEGQIRGIQKMIIEERDCQDIFQQISAAKSAFNSASTIILKEYISNCVSDISNNPDQFTKEDLVNDLINLVNKVS